MSKMLVIRVLRASALSGSSILRKTRKIVVADAEKCRTVSSLSLRTCKISAVFDGAVADHTCFTSNSGPARCPRHDGGRARSVPPCRIGRKVVRKCTFADTFVHTFDWPSALSKGAFGGSSFPSKNEGFMPLEPYQLFNWSDLDRRLRFNPRLRLGAR